MIITTDLLLRVAIFVLATAGYFVARHIHKQKSTEQPLVCPLNMDCEGVVRSDYSTIFGIHLEVLGMFYYGFLSLSYLLFIFFPSMLPNYMVGIVAVLSLIAFLFSAYLVSIMTFVLKKGCYWCFVSAAFCLIIFALSYMAYDFTHIAQFFAK